MEKKKKREKGPTNGASGVETDTGQVQVDLLKRQREAEQQIAGGPAKKLLMSAPTPPVVAFNPSQPYPVGQWQFAPPPPPPPPPPPQFSNAPQPLAAHSQPQTVQSQPAQQSQSQPQQQPQLSQQQPQQVGSQQAQGQAHTGQLPPFWGGSEFGPQPPPGQYYGFPSSSTDANWQASAYGGPQAVGSSVPYAYPGAYGYPAGAGQPGFAGSWDQSWWGTNPAQPQALFTGGYGAPFQGYAGGYAYGAPPGAPGVPFQRGFIKAPVGLSQKHQRLWEGQSTENIQMWSALARAEAELVAQRSKILQLEAELHSFKGHQEIPLDVSAAHLTSLQPARRGRHKKTTGVITPDTGLPRTRGRKPAVEKLLSDGRDKSEDKSEDKETELEGKSLLIAGKPLRNEERKKNIDSKENKNKFNSVTGRGLYDGGVCATDSSHHLNNDEKTMQYGGPFRSNFHTDSGLENGVHRNGHSLDKNGAVVVGDPNYPSYEVKGPGSGECEVNPHRGSHAGISDGPGGEDWSAATDDRNGTFESRILYDSSAVDRPTRKGIPDWGEYGGEDVSEEHEVDEVVPSGQEDDDEVDDDDDSGLRDISGTKVHNLVGIGSAKGIAQLNRWP